MDGESIPLDERPSIQPTYFVLIAIYYKTSWIAARYIFSWLKTNPRSGTT